LEKADIEKQTIIHFFAFSFSLEKAGV